MNARDHLKLLNPTSEFLTIALISLSLMSPAFAEGSPTGRPGAPQAREAAPARKGGANDLSTMLPFLITSPDRERLAADLLLSLERGDLKKAEGSLNAAIEAGTLAIALMDRLHDPDLLSTLQGLGLEARQQPVSATSCPVPAQPIAAANLVEMQEALDREQAYGGMISRTLTDLMEQYNSLTARLEADSSGTKLKVAELQHALQQEKQQREAIMQEFTSLQADYRTLQDAGKSAVAAKPQDTSRLEALLQHERERGNSIERELIRAREEVRGLQALKEQEAASATRIAGLEDSLSQAQERANDLAQKLADVTQALHSLQEAQERIAPPPMPQPAPVEAEAFTTLLQERAPAPSPPAVASAEASIVPMNDEPTTQAVTFALPSQGTAAVVIAQLPEAPRSLSARIAPVDPPVSMKTVPAPEPKAGPPPQEIKVEDRLTARADELFRKGDVSGARLLLERSLKDGNARAAFLLAETFDPHVLSKRGVRGIRGDADKAREYYAQAQALGVTQASERMEALK